MPWLGICPGFLNHAGLESSAATSQSQSDDTVYMCSKTPKNRGRVGTARLYTPVQRGGVQLVVLAHRV